MSAAHTHGGCVCVFHIGTYVENTVSKRLTRFWCDTVSSADFINKHIYYFVNEFKCSLILKYVEELKWNWWTYYCINNSNIIMISAYCKYIIWKWAILQNEYTFGTLRIFWCWYISLTFWKQGFYFRVFSHCAPLIPFNHKHMGGPPTEKCKRNSFGS